MAPKPTIWSQRGSKTSQLEPRMHQDPFNLEPKWLPRPPTNQDGSQDPQLGTEMTQTPQLGAQLALETSNSEPRWTQKTPTWSRNGPQDPPLGAKIGPKTPNLEPHCSKNLSTPSRNKSKPAGTAKPVRRAYPLMRMCSKNHPYYQNKSDSNSIGNGNSK